MRGGGGGPKWEDLWTSAESGSAQQGQFDSAPLADKATLNRRSLEPNFESDMTIGYRLPQEGAPAGRVSAPPLGSPTQLLVTHENYVRRVCPNGVHALLPYGQMPAAADDPVLAYGP